MPTRPPEPNRGALVKLLASSGLFATREGYAGSSASPSFPAMINFILCVCWQRQGEFAVVGVTGHVVSLTASPQALVPGHTH